MAGHTKMAQTGYTPISLYYTTTASAAPTAGNLVAGELAINTNDGVLYYKDSSGVVQSIASKAVNSGSFTNLAYTGTLTGGTGIVNLGSGQFYKDASGNVGINTTSMFGKFNVKQANEGAGTNSASGLTVQRSANDSYLGIQYQTTPDAWAISASYSSTGAYKPLIFETSDLERMRIDSSGNVGIGTSSPSAKLDVRVTGTGQRIYGGSGTLSTLELGGLSSGGDNATIASTNNLVFQVDSNNNVGGRTFDWKYGGKGYSDGTLLMRIDSSGRVSINTTSPSTGVFLNIAGTLASQTCIGLTDTGTTYGTGSQYLAFLNSMGLNVLNPIGA